MLCHSDSGSPCLYKMGFGEVRQMDEKELYEIISSQKDCFARDCKHKCSKCKYQKDPQDIALAYITVLDLIQHQKDIKTEFFNSGIEYAKNEFALAIENEKSKMDSLYGKDKISDIRYIQVLGLQKAAKLIKKIAIKKPNGKGIKR